MFEPGTVIVFDPDSFNPSFWNNLSEKEKIKYYGQFGYGKSKPEYFVYLCDIILAQGQDTGHGVIVSLDDQRVITMIHPNNFRETTEEEF